MKNICFRKVKGFHQDKYLVIFEQGAFGKPLVILNEGDVLRLKDEWRWD